MDVLSDHISVRRTTARVGNEGIYLSDVDLDEVS